MNHIIHVFAETSYHGELTNLKCLHRYSTLKRGEGSFVALLEKWENLRFRKRSINSPMRKLESSFKENGKIGYLSGIVTN